jgi:hypothetical protein
MAVSVPFAQIRARTDAGDAHFPHVALHSLAVDKNAVSAQLFCDAPRPVERVVRVQLVDLMLDLHLLWRRSNRLVVQACSFQTQQVSLGRQWEVWVVSLQESHPFISRQAPGQLFF